MTAPPARPHRDLLLRSVVLIGLITGADGMARIESFIVSPFQGVLCLCGSTA